MSIDNRPTISVVMSCYNASKYLRLAIDSILSQTYSDFEFIIWNDGSTDDTEAIIQSYTDTRIRYFYHANTGLGQALCLACREARGEYIARMDADDIALPHRLATELDFLESNKDHVLVSSAINYIDDEGEYLGRSFPYTWDSIIKSVIFTNTFIVHPAVMFRREAYLASEGYLNVFGAEDRVLWGRMRSYGKYANLPMPLLNYRLLSGSLSHGTIDPSYLTILRCLREKMAKDETVSNDDLLLHNQIFVYSKQHSKVEAVSSNFFPEIGYRINHLYDLLRKYIGKDLVATSIICCKNLYGYLKYVLHLLGRK